jgi:RNA polymerase sigma-70 factor, ECF subfamily
VGRVSEGFASAVDPDAHGPDPEERRLLARLRAGDEAAFVELVERHHGSMLRLAMTWVSTRDVAEEVVQDTWLGVLRGLDRFEGRSTLRTWIFRILANRAKTRGGREGRSIPFASLADPAAEGGEPSVDPDRFLPPDHIWAGHWAVAPQAWAPDPSDRLMAVEVAEVIRRAIDALSPSQREVITLHDVEGCPSGEICDLLEISEGNHRVLLHRARSRVRAALEDYYARAAAAGGLSPG